MSGMLTVVGNPRRRRKKKAARVGRKKSARRRSAVSRASNPSRRRSGRRAVARRRRHSNPMLGGGMIGTVIKGVTVGVGAIAARVAANAVNNLAFKTAPLSGVAKIGLEAGVGVAGYMALKAVKQGAFANSFAIGAGIVVALDIYDLFIKGMLPATLQDYSYGSLNDYAYGSLNGWAPQDGEGLSGGSVYTEGAYS